MKINLKNKQNENIEINIDNKNRTRFKKFKAIIFNIAYLIFISILIIYPLICIALLSHFNKIVEYYIPSNVFLSISLSLIYMLIIYFSYRDKNNNKLCDDCLDYIKNEITYMGAIFTGAITILSITDKNLRDTLKLIINNASFVSMTLLTIGIFISIFNTILFWKYLNIINKDANIHIDNTCRICPLILLIVLTSVSIFTF